MTRAPVRSAVLDWAIERSGIDTLELEGRFPKLPQWLAGDLHPTLKQLEDFARAVHVPVGFLFLPEPPPELLPIPDFRTIAGRPLTRPSPNLLDMIYVCQERQGWYREYAQLTRQPELDFVGSETTTRDPVNVAERMRARLEFDLDARRDCPTWAEALRLFIQQADRIGVLVMISGIVLSNTHRTLSVGEFRGFALSDRLAPLVFINGTDSKSAQMFTLAHELAHLWLGTSALSDIGVVPAAGYRQEEIWCNQVAAELLVPLSVLRQELQPNEPTERALSRLARRFKVSTLVILRRMLDSNWLSRDAFDQAWAVELARIEQAGSANAGGGDFFRSTIARVSRRFGRAIVESTLEGQTLYRDAFRMLGISKTETFKKFTREVGVQV
jgi:Zn-dependent peptidase ImmA (M78 family)